VTEPKNPKLKGVHMEIIGIISDTHIPSRTKEVPTRVFEIFNDVNLIIHAGDLVHLNVIKELEKIAPVMAVYGNMDPYEVRKHLPWINSIALNDWKIGVFHDPGALWGMSGMRKIARENDFDALIFGHTHKSFVKEERGFLFINPGSPTNPLPPLLAKPSVGLLKVTKEKIEPIIVKF